MSFSKEQEGKKLTRDPTGTNYHNKLLIGEQYVFIFSNLKERTQKQNDVFLAPNDDMFE